MLNHPLSLLSDDLFPYIVDHVAELPSPNKHLCSLSIADRAFTQFCQAHIFKVLYLGYGSGTKDSISSHLEKIRKILDDKPSFANSVRVVNLTIAHNQNTWLFNNPTFTRIFQLLAKSLIPPHKLHLSGVQLSGSYRRLFIFEKPRLAVEQLTQTFFSQTLTVLHLTYCENVPLTLFLICPGLREILLDGVEASDEDYNQYPDGQCSGRELPTLDSLDYCDSGGLVRQMITPPPRFNSAVILWSKLRVLTLCPHKEEEIACLQPILNLACNTLEELYLTRLEMEWSIPFDQLSLAGFVDLRELSSLRVFRLHSFINCDALKPAILRDINLVLSTIPTFNKVTSLAFNFAVSDKHPFYACLEQDWVGLCDEAVRISEGKHLKLTFDVLVFEFRFLDPPVGQEELEELCERIKEKTASLSECPNISICIPPALLKILDFDEGSTYNEY